MRRLLGQFLRTSGGYTFDAATGTLSAVSVVVETESVDTHHEARDRHLRSGDFLDSAAHPTMTFSADERAAHGRANLRRDGRAHAARHDAAR